MRFLDYHVEIGCIGGHYLTIRLRARNFYEVIVDWGKA